MKRLGIILLLPWPVLAQYSPARLLGPNPVGVRGVVTQVEWINPQTFLHLNVKNASGSVTNWSIALSSPSSLKRLSVTERTLKAGDEIEIEVFVVRGVPRAEAKQGGTLTLADGRKLRMPFWSASGRYVRFQSAR